MAVLSLVDLKVLRWTWIYSKKDFAAVAATIFVTLGVGIETGVLAGVILGIAFSIPHQSAAHGRGRPGA